MIGIKQALIVALGGALGSVSRFLLGSVISHTTTDARFPFATFTVNVLGCLVGGLLTGFIEEKSFFNSDVRLFLFVGLLGGFTTFSAFSLESVSLWRRGEISIAVLYVAASVLCGLGAFVLGVKACQS